jgi:hypothetical protein
LPNFPFFVFFFKCCMPHGLYSSYMYRQPYVISVHAYT